MPQQHDITLGATGYMVVPKTYRRGHDASGLLGSAPVRQVQREFAGGLRAAMAERDRFASSLALFPSRTGPGVEAGPAERTQAGTADPTARRYSVIVAGIPYIGAGGVLWRMDRAGVGINPNNMGAPTTMGAVLPGNCDGLATNGDTLIYMSHAGANPYTVWTVGGVAWDVTPTLQFHGLAHYAGSLWGGYLNAGQWRIARATSGAAIDGAGYPIIGQPTAMISGRDGIYTATLHGLWLTRAKASGTAGNTLDVDHQQLVKSEGSGRPDDWSYLCDHSGQLYAWFNGGVHRYHAGGSAPAQLVPLGLWGQSCAGLCSAGGYLIAAVYPERKVVPHAATNLFAWDGQGWWQLTDETLTANGASATGGYLEDATLVTSDGGNWRGYQLRPLVVQPGLAAAGELVTSLWAGRDPDAAKVWTMIGAEFGSLVYDTFGSCTVYLDYSLDGNTYTNAASQAITSSAPVTISAELPSTVQGKALSLRYRLSGVTTGTPVLRALWAEYRPLEAPKRRRHWEMELYAGDATITRDGQPDPRTGAAIAADLWSQFETGGVLGLKDVDYDLDPTLRNVRISFLDELMSSTKDGGRWGQSTLKVRLVED